MFICINSFSMFFIPSFPNFCLMVQSFMPSKSRHVVSVLLVLFKVVEWSFERRNCQRLIWLAAIFLIKLFSFIFLHLKLQIMISEFFLTLFFLSTWRELLLLFKRSSRLLFWCSSRSMWFKTFMIHSKNICESTLVDLLSFSLYIHFKSLFSYLRRDIFLKIKDFWCHQIHFKRN